LARARRVPGSPGPVATEAVAMVEGSGCAPQRSTWAHVTWMPAGPTACCVCSSTVPERRNALTIEMYHGLKKAAVLAERDPAIDVLLVTTAGHFCVGGEMGGRHEGGAGLDRETDGIDLLPFVQFERCPKLVVLGINGTCQGGGLNLTLTADLAVASERATFRAPELLRGVRSEERRGGEGCR